MPLPFSPSSTLCALAFALGLGVSLPARAWQLEGSKSVFLHTRDGQSLALGQVEFKPGGDARTAFALKLDSDRFKDFFLSMKEFKCLEGGGEVTCHVPYPYSHPGTVTPTDLAWLEHSLLFLFKLPNEFGAKLWNGLYFKLAMTENGLVGTPQAIDLNLISAPPADPSKPPYRPALRDDMPTGARWAAQLTIE